MSDVATSRPEFDQFLAEYFVECDEHLDVSRRCLLALESGIGDEEPDRQLLDELFRSFHSIKGLSAMVSIGEAETLAHHLESYLGELRRGKLRLSAHGLESLIAGVKNLDRILAARREHASGPDCAPVLSELAALLVERPGDSSARALAPVKRTAATLPATETDNQIAARLRPGIRAWTFVFVPSPELSERGVNVNSVRQRLQELGEILRAVPQVLPGGHISFSFIVGTAQPETEFQNWREDGLTYSSLSANPSGVQAAEPDKAAPELTGSRAPHLAAGNVVRVDLGRIDDLMQKVGDLTLSRARLEESMRRLRGAIPAADWNALQETNQAMERQLRDLRDGVMRVRMVPFREVFARMQFVVRDLAHEFNKKVALQLLGEETEIDKFVVERMMDPLLHLVRNAVSHGLESPEARVAAGKPAEARIALRARTTGETVTLEVEDDGRGIDAEQVFARARATGMLAAETPATPELLLDVLCTPGFSIREKVDRVSGRGVGMDVVRRAVEELDGSLMLHTELGKETRFVIELPLTLAIADALIVIVDGEKYAIPQGAVREVLQIAPAVVRVLERNEIISYRASVLPLFRLNSFFGNAGRREGEFYVLVLGEGVHAVGITVDRVLGLREIVVRPITDKLIRVEGIAGATELGDGRVVLILDASGLARAARRANPGRSLTGSATLAASSAPSNGLRRRA